jgi:hypothetical protein
MVLTVEVVRLGQLVTTAITLVVVTVVVDGNDNNVCD